MASPDWDKIGQIGLGVLGSVVPGGNLIAGAISSSFKPSNRDTAGAPAPARRARTPRRAQREALSLVPRGVAQPPGMQGQRGQGGELEQVWDAVRGLTAQNVEQASAIRQLTELLGGQSTVLDQIGNVIGMDKVPAFEEAMRNAQRTIGGLQSKCKCNGK